MNVNNALKTTLLAAALFTTCVANGQSIDHLMQKVRKPEVKREFKESSYFSLNKLYSRFVSWGINPKSGRSSINLKDAWTSYSKKKEIIVAVVDTGIDPNHPFLANNIYVANGTPSNRNYGIDFSKRNDGKYKPFDTHGHGTHVSGIVKSVFPDVKILPLKYYNPSATGQENLSATIEALRYAVEQNVDIINYSGGGPEPSLEELSILKKAEKKGILVVAAAGNETSDIDDKSNKYFPASYGLSNIITVTAYNKALKVTSPFNYGKRTVDIAAPGYRIKSALPGSRTGYLTGTSQATAFVSGLAALMKSNYPKMNAKDLKAAIKKSARQEISLIGTCATNGKVDAAKAMMIAKKRFGKKGDIAKRNIATKAKSRIIYRESN